MDLKLKIPQAKENWLNYSQNKMKINLTLRRPHLHEYPDTIDVLRKTKKQKYHFKVELEKNFSVRLGQCICRSYMTGKRCFSIHLGQSMTVIDPVRPNVEYKDASPLFEKRILGM